MKTPNYIFASVLFLMLASCVQPSTQPPIQPKDEPTTSEPTTVELPWTGKHKDAALWTEKLKQSVIKKELVKLTPSDVNMFCPGYDKADEQGRLTAWMHLFAIMAKYESSYNPKTFYMEPPPLGYHSIGLFQLSYEDQPNYPECALSKSEKNLEDGVHNIKCAVVILAKLVKENGQIAGKVSGKWQGGARYWSVLRVTQNNGSPRPAYDGILRHMKSVAVCK